MFEEQFFYRESLKESLVNFKERNYLIDGLLYEHSSLMIYAADGLGKSCVTLQAMLEAGSEVNVYGVFKVSKPLRVLWVMAERHPIEIFERIKEMGDVIPINFDNFAITTELQGSNLLDEKQFSAAVHKIDSRVKQLDHVDIIVIDPIYALVAGGLGKDENNSYVTRFSTMLQNEFGCSVIFLHHPNRGVRDETGQRHSEDMYGGRFLSAHFTGIYHITKSKSSNGTHFQREKNSHRNLIDAFDLSYDINSYISTVQDDSMLKKDRIMIELRRYKAQDKWFELDALAKSLSLSTNYLFKLFSREILSDIEKKPNTDKRKTLYRYVGI